MAEERRDPEHPEPSGDRLRELVSSEIQSAISEMFPGGIEGTMNLVVGKVADEVIPRLPKVDVEAIAQRSAEIARAEMEQTAHRIRESLQTETGPSQTNGYAPDTPVPEAPEGYAYSTAAPESTPGERVRQSIQDDPISWINLLFDKTMTVVDKVSAHRSSTDKLALLRQVQHEEPELLNIFVPSPWGPEFQRMMEQSYAAGLKAKAGGAGRPYNPFDWDGSPSDGYDGEPGVSRRPQPGERVSGSESRASDSGNTTEGTGGGYGTEAVRPVTMAELLAKGR